MPAYALIVCAATALSGQTYTALESFNGSDGAYPFANLVQATDGNLYGSANGGGANSAGNIFKVTPAGALTVLYNFCGQSGCADGQGPVGGLVQAGNGDFYGTTFSGGAGNGGTVFAMTPGGVLTTLHSFCAQSGCADGQNPYAGLVQGANGDFYGTTVNGGANGDGVVFRITASGAFTVLHRFCAQTGCADGSHPYAGLIQAINGQFYGTTSAGGAHGGGTVFKITASGTLTTVYDFCAQSGCADGSNPNALLQTPGGDFYGTTFLGGANGGGVIFKLTPAGALTVLYTFCSQGGAACTDGASPYSGLILGSDHDFYGTAGHGGANAGGTIFRMTAAGALTTLYNFCSQGGALCMDGGNPIGALAQDTNGAIYGTAELGGSVGNGTLFRLSAGLKPFVETQPSAGKAGAAVRILGTNLSGTSAVTFNGTAAAFDVVSSSEITATVPGGATTGPVQVTTPGGTLSSNVPFRVE